MQRQTFNNNIDFRAFVNGGERGMEGGQPWVLPHNIRGCLDKNAYYSIGRRTKRQHNYGGFLINSLESSANDKL